MLPKERPILFSAPMVRAILDGRKTMTRRVVKPQPEAFVSSLSINEHGIAVSDNEAQNQIWKCPYGSPGDILWVKETHLRIPGHSLHQPHYMADGPRPSISERHDAGLLRSYPSIHMPRWASRITLQVEAVRVERLQELTDEDAVAEGMHKFHSVEMYGYDPHGTPGNCVGDSAREAFALLWSKINGPDSWDANPWVWVVSFSRLQ